jgi:hypothetical protein
MFRLIHWRAFSTGNCKSVFPGTSGPFSAAVLPWRPSVGR